MVFFVLEFSLKMWRCEDSDQVALGREDFDPPVQDQGDGLAEALHAHHHQFHALIHGAVLDQLVGVITTQDNHGVLQDLLVVEPVVELL